MKIRVYKRVGLVVLALLALAATPASATPTLTLFDGTTTVTIVDGGAGDACGLAGCVTYAGALGVWNINVSTGTTKPVFGSAAAPKLDLSTIDQSTDAGILIITWSDTDFLLFPGSALAHAGGTADGSVLFSTFSDATNLLAGTGTLMTQQAFLAPALSFSGDASGGSIGGTPYSLTEQVIITHTAAGQTSGDFKVSIVPEPASMALFGGVLLFTATVIRRRRRVS